MDKFCPYYLQTGTNTCVVTALQIVNAYWLRKKEEKELLRLAGTNTVGTTAVGIARAAFAKGFEVTLFCQKGGKCFLATPDERLQNCVQNAREFDNVEKAFENLCDAIKEENPIIVFIDQDGKFHAVVIVKITEEKVICLDPELPTFREIALKPFCDCWEKSANIGILLEPRPCRNTWRPFCQFTNLGSLPLSPDHCIV